MPKKDTPKSSITDDKKERTNYGYIFAILFVALGFSVARGFAMLSKDLMTQEEFNKMLEIEDPYAILEASPSTSQDELHKKWKKVMVQNHPDRHPGDEEKREKYLTINSAYDLLKTKEKRTYYNRIYRFKKVLYHLNKAFEVLNKPTRMIRDRYNLDSNKEKEALIYNLEFAYSMIVAIIGQVILLHIFALLPKFITSPIYFIFDWVTFLTFCPLTIPWRMLNWINDMTWGLLMVAPISFT